jgi:phytol kinase
MCGGDGLAEILGRAYGNASLPWTKNKTWVGSLGMFLGGWVFAVTILTIYITNTVFPNSIWSYLPAITAIAAAGTFVESLPFRDIDNITVTLTAVAIGHLLL